MYQRILFLCFLTTMAVNGVVAKELDRAGLLNRVVGNTIHFQGGGEHVFEYLDPAGEIRGESSVKGKFTAHWRLLDDHTICFESADPMASGCVAVQLSGKTITFLRRDGVVEGPFDFLPGNPRGL